MTLPTSERRSKTHASATLLTAVLAILGLLAFTADTQAERPFHLRLGYSNWGVNDLGRQDATAALGVLTRRLASRNGWTSEVRGYDSTQAMERASRDQRIDILAVFSEEYVELRKRIPIEAVVATASELGREDELLLLVRKDSGIRSVRELRKRTVVIPQRSNQSDNMYRVWLETLMMRQGLPSLEKSATTIREIPKLSRVVMPVFFRSVDACVINRHHFELASELNPQIGRELTPIATTGRLTTSVIAMDRRLPEDIRVKARQVLLSMNSDREGRQILTLFKAKKLVPFNPDCMKTTEALYAEHRSLKMRATR